LDPVDSFMLVSTHSTCLNLLYTNMNILLELLFNIGFKSTDPLNFLICLMYSEA
jgi:hypothetical protein